MCFPLHRKWIPGIGIDLITANFKQHSSSLNQPKKLNQPGCSLLTHLPDTFDVFTESGSLTPFQICGLFQYFRQSPQYKYSCFHQQCNDFYASKTSKTLDVQGPNSDDDDEDAPIQQSPDAKN